MYKRKDENLISHTLYALNMYDFDVFFYVEHIKDCMREKKTYKCKIIYIFSGVNFWRCKIFDIESNKII